MGPRRLDRATLEKNRIFFFEKKGENIQLPDHVNSLRCALLDFACTISARLSFYDEDDYEDPEMLNSILSKLYVKASERDSIERTISVYREMKRKAQNLDNGRDREAEWVRFYENNFLDKLFNEFEITDEDSRRVARAKFYYDEFDVAKERPWSLFRGHRDFRKQYGKTNLTMPVPDWAAYFRVYDPESSWTRIPNSSSRWPLANSVTKSIVENFSLPMLKVLAKRSLQFSVADIFRRDQTSSIVLSDLLCYPWLITEYKRNEKRKDMECYCQAANAGAASLMLLQTLVKHSTCKTVLPVVTMTTWGPEVRVWICFFDNLLEEYKMVCIWEGNMNRIVHMVELHAILENTHTWAMRVLRPWISHHIDQWKSFCNMGCEQEENDENISIDNFGALTLAKFRDERGDELQGEGDSDQEMEYPEMRDFFKKQNSLLLAEMRELFGTLGANSNILQQEKRFPLQTRSISTQTDNERSKMREGQEEHQQSSLGKTSNFVSAQPLFKGTTPDRVLVADHPSDPLCSINDSIRYWKESGRPSSIGITRHAESRNYNNVQPGGYPYLTFTKGEVLRLRVSHHHCFLAQKFGIKHSTGWILMSSVEVRQYDPLQIPKNTTTASKITELNMNGSDIFKVSLHQTTANSGNKRTDQHDHCSASISTADIRIKPIIVTSEKTGLRVKIKLPPPTVKSLRSFTEEFSHRNGAASKFSGAEPSSWRPPNPASQGQPSTSGANHGVGADISISQGGKIDLFKFFKNGDVKDGLFEGLGSIGWKPRFERDNSDGRKSQEDKVLFNNLFMVKDKVHRQELLGGNGYVKQNAKDCASSEEDWETTDEE